MQASVAEQLRVFFERNAYVRRQNPERLAADGWRRYKKGDEVRFVARSEQELALIRELLTSAGFKPGSAYAQGSQHRQPVYGRRQVTRLLEFIESSHGARRPTRASSDGDSAHGLRSEAG